MPKLSPDTPKPKNGSNDILEGYLRVSTILDYFAEPKLVDWMVKKGPGAKKLTKQAMKIGTEVDSAVKSFVTTGVKAKPKTQEAASCLDGFYRWFEDYHPNLKVGTRLYNEEYKVTGEPDLYWGDRIIDIKCSSEIRPKYHVQTGAYASMDKKLSTGILRLHKQLEDYEYVERDDAEVLQDSYCFHNLLQAYNHLQKLLLGAKGEQYDNPAD